MNEKKTQERNAWICLGIAGVPGCLTAAFGLYVIFAGKGIASGAEGRLLWIWLALTLVSLGCGLYAALRPFRLPAAQRARREAKEDREKLFFLRLLRGEAVGEADWQEYAGDEELGADGYYALATIVLRPDRTQPAAPGLRETVREDQVCRKLIRELPETLKGQLRLPPVCIAGGSISFFFTGEKEGALLDRIRAFYRGLEAFAGPLWLPGFCMGISAVHTERGHIREASQESVRALILSRAERETGGGEASGCHFYSGSEETSEGFLDFRYGQEIQRGLKGIDRALCGQALDGFENFLRRTAGREEEVIYILQFLSAVLSVALETGLDLHSLCPGGLVAFCDDLLWMPEPSRVRRLIEVRLVDSVLRMRSELLEKGARSMMEEVERLIRERQGNITLTECAFALQVHPSYIWKLLKTEKGKSFSDYLEQYKLEEAKRLLLETDLTVAQIAARLNYSNAQNFIRFFSKSTGITPGKFRKQE